MSKDWEYAEYSAWTKQMGGPQEIKKIVERMDSLDIVKAAEFQKGKMSILKKAPPALLIAAVAGATLMEGYHWMKQRKADRNAEMQYVAEKAQEAEVRLRNQVYQETVCVDGTAADERGDLDETAKPNV